MLFFLLFSNYFLNLFSCQLLLHLDCVTVCLLVLWWKTITKFYLRLSSIPHRIPYLKKATEHTSPPIVCARTCLATLSSNRTGLSLCIICYRLIYKTYGVRRLLPLFLATLAARQVGLPCWKGPWSSSLDVCITFSAAACERRCRNSEAKAVLSIGAQRLAGRDLGACKVHISYLLGLACMTLASGYLSR